MIEDWKEYRLGDLGDIVTGRTPPSSRPECFGDEFPFITPSDMVGQKRASTTNRYLSAAGAELLKRTLLPPGSVAVSCIGWQMGKSIMTARPSFTNQQLNTIIPNMKVKPDFLYYVLVTWRERLLSLGAATGVRTPILNKSAFSDLRIQIPPLPIQRKIAAVLSAYDDLIENNTRRIAILEEMAQAIYREWFAEFRFPGHEQVKLVESELGPVPEGWEVKPFSETVEINPTISVNKETEKPFVEMANLTTNSMVIECTQTRTGRNGSKFQNDDTLFPRITPSVENGKRGFVQFLGDAEVGLGSTEFIVLRSKSLCPEYVYLLSIQSDFRDHAAKSMVGASGRQRVQYQCFDNYFIVQPPPDLLNKFSGVVSPMFQIVHTMNKKNTILRQTRDLLLPRLVSGEVDVLALEIAGVG